MFAPIFVAPLLRKSCLLQNANKPPQSAKRLANTKAAAVCWQRLFHSAGIGRLSTELILAILGDHSNGVSVLKVRGSTRELRIRRLASMDLLWAPMWGAIDAVTQAEALTLVPAVPTHSPLFCLTLVL